MSSHHACHLSSAGADALVHYTDAAYWQSHAGDFDEQTADSWDIDIEQSMEQAQERRHERKEYAQYMEVMHDGMHVCGEYVEIVMRCVYFM